ncbi:MAG TPA: carbon starvation CstA family protein, partial [Gemmatimonadaceae bacterium]
MRRILHSFLLVVIALLGAASFAWLALRRGETVNAAWLLTAAICTYIVAYRVYSKLIAVKVFELDEDRATPAVRLNDGRDYTPT